MGCMRAHLVIVCLVCERGVQRRSPARPAVGFVYPKQVTTGMRGPELSKTPYAGFQVAGSERLCVCKRSVESLIMAMIKIRRVK